MSLCMYKEGGSKKYILLEPYRDTIPFIQEDNIHTEWCSLWSDGVIHIDQGYEWDGASGPTIDTDNTMDGALVHDVLYQLMREEWLSINYRKAADQCIRQMCIADGMSVIRAYYWYLALRVGGGSSARG